MNKKLLPISNMYLAVALLSYGGEIDHTDRTNEKRIKFYFIDGPMTVWKYADAFVSQVDCAGIDQVKLMFASSTLMFPPNFADKIRRIKSIIYDK